MKQYPAEEGTIRYLERNRWGDTPTCVECEGTEKIKPQARHPGRHWCGNCRRYFTARTGTPLEHSKVDVRKWLFAAYLLMTAHKGVSSLQLSKELSVTQTNRLVHAAPPETGVRPWNGSAGRGSRNGRDLPGRQGKEQA